MTGITEKDIRELYASANRYDPKHLRHDLNGAEFDGWLEAHDSQLTHEVLHELLKSIEALGKTSSNLMLHARPIVELVEERVNAARDAAIAAGAQDNETTDGN